MTTTTGELSDRASTHAPEPVVEQPARRRPPHLAAGLETLALLVSPVVALFALRIRAMAPSDEPDPSIHTTFIVDPRDIFARYSVLFSPTARLRESARVGFLVPARLAYLAFGAVPGFFVTRYLFVLIAIVPVYLLLRRLYGAGAGAIGALVFLTCPVVLTAWGTDYPDSAVVSYMAGARRVLGDAVRRALAPVVDRGAAVLITLAVWAHGIGILLAVCTLLAYVAIRFLRERRQLVVDLAIMAGVFAVVTGALSILSELLLGHFNFIEPTWGAFRYLSRPDQIAMWHSASWRWAPYVVYILVPPAVVGAFLVTFARRHWRDLSQISTPILFIGAVSVLDVVVFWFMQFFGNLQTLEMHLFSSTLWSAICITLAITIAELAKPLLEHRIARWVPAAAVIVIVLVYELHPRIRSFGWFPYGFLTAAVLIAFAAGGRLSSSLAGSRNRRWIGSTVAIMGVAATALFLTVVTVPTHRQLPNTVPDPAPAYSTALGGSATYFVDYYRVTAELPLWVGNPSYPGEILVTWWPVGEANSLNGPVGVFHSGFTSLPLGPPTMNWRDLRYIRLRKAPQLLMFSWSGNSFAAGVKALAVDDPRVVKRAVLSSGNVHLHVWLVDLMRYFQPGVS